MRNSRNTGAANPASLPADEDKYLTVGPLRFARFFQNPLSPDPGERWAWYGGIAMERGEIIANAHNLLNQRIVAVPA